VKRADAAESQLQQLRREQRQLHEQQQRQDARALQTAEQAASIEMTEAQQQLAAAVRDLEAERANSGQLHVQVTRLQNEFGDARELSSCHGLPVACVCVCVCVCV
jgi:hypothetical protein